MAVRDERTCTSCGDNFPVQAYGPELTTCDNCALYMAAATDGVGLAVDPLDALLKALRRARSRYPSMGAGAVLRAAARHLGKPLDDILDLSTARLCDAVDQYLDEH